MAIHKIHINKAGKSAFIEVDDSTFDDGTFAAIVAEGLKACLNAKMSKVGAVTKLEGAELEKAQAEALRIANANLSDLQSGKYKFPGVKATAPEKREVVNEAMRLARDFVREQIKAAGYKISHIPAKDITAAAKSLVDTEPKWKEKAKENLAHRSEVPVEQRIDLAALGLRPDPEKIAKSEAAAVKRKENLSAAQAGKVKPVAGKATKAKGDKPSVGAILGGTTTPSHAHPGMTH